MNLRTTKERITGGNSGRVQNPIFPKIFVNPYFYGYLCAPKRATVDRFHMTTRTSLMDGPYTPGPPLPSSGTLARLNVAGSNSEPYRLERNVSHRKQTTPPPSNSELFAEIEINFFLRQAKKRLIATLPISSIHSTHWKQSTRRNSNRNKTALFTKREETPLAGQKPRLLTRIAAAGPGPCENRAQANASKTPRTVLESWFERRQRRETAGRRAASDLLGAGKRKAE